MQEEISIVELIKMLWKKKGIIIVVTIAAFILALLTCKFIIKPTYSAQSSILVKTSSDNPTPYSLTPFIEQAKSDVIINRTINNLKLDTKEFTPQGIKNSLTITNATSNLAVLNVKGSNQGLITDIVNNLTGELASIIETSDRSDRIINYKKQLIEAEDKLQQTESELAQAKQELVNTPKILTTKKSILENPYLSSLFDGRGNNLEFINEEINQVYLDINNKITDLSISISKMNSEVATVKERINSNETEIDNLNKSSKYLDKSVIRSTDGMFTLMITPAIEPKQKISPNTLLSSLIAGIAGALLSTLIVMVQWFWKKQLVLSEK